MFGIGSTELLIICVVALIIVGPSKLPTLLKGLGKGLAEFKRMGTDVKQTLETEIEKAEDAAKKKEAEAKLAAKEKEAEAAEEPATPVADADAADKAGEAGSRGA